MMRGIILIILTAVLLSGCGGGEVTAASGVGTADLTGTWDYMGSGTVIDPITENLCGYSFKGILTIQSDGEIDISEMVHDSCNGDSSNLLMGTAHVLSNGSGTFRLPPDQEIPFQLSRDKNTIIFAFVNTSENFTSGIAYRR